MRRIYRVLGVEHVRHCRPAAPEVVLRRLLSLDYLFELPHTARERLHQARAAP